jgi:hypothetical protein
VNPPSKKKKTNFFRRRGEGMGEEKVEEGNRKEDNVISSPDLP